VNRIYQIVRQRKRIRRKENDQSLNLPIYEESTQFHERKVSENSPVLVQEKVVEKRVLPPVVVIELIALPVKWMAVLESRKRKRKERDPEKAENAEKGERVRIVERRDAELKI
jgi:hypothetical protein